MAQVRNYQELSSTPVGPYQRPINEDQGAAVWQNLGDLGQGLLRVSSDLGQKAQEARRTQQTLAKQNEAFDLFNKLSQDAAKQPFQTREAFYNSGVANIKEQLFKDITDEKVLNYMTQDFEGRRENGLVNVQSDVLKLTGSQAVADWQTGADNFLQNQGGMPMSQQAVEIGKQKAQLQSLQAQGFISPEEAYARGKKLDSDVDDGNLTTLMNSNPVAGLNALKDPKQFTNLTAEGRANWTARMENKADDFGVQQFNTVLMNQGPYAAMAWVKNKANTANMEPKTVNGLIGQSQSGIDKAQMQSQLNSDVKYADASAYAVATGKLPDPDDMKAIGNAKDGKYKLANLQELTRLKPMVDLLKSGDVAGYQEQKTALENEIKSDPAHAASKQNVLDAVNQAEANWKQGMKDDPQGTIQSGQNQTVQPITPTDNYKLDDLNNPYAIRIHNFEQQQKQGFGSTARLFSNSDLNQIATLNQNSNAVDQAKLQATIISQFPPQYQAKATAELAKAKAFSLSSEIVSGANSQALQNTNPTLAQTIQNAAGGLDDVKEEDLNTQLNARSKDLATTVEKAVADKMAPFAAAKLDGTAVSTQTYMARLGERQKLAKSLLFNGQAKNADDAATMATADMFANYGMSKTYTNLAVPSTYVPATIDRGFEAWLALRLPGVNLYHPTADKGWGQYWEDAVDSARGGLQALGKPRMTSDGSGVYLLDARGNKVMQTVNGQIQPVVIPFSLLQKLGAANAGPRAVGGHGGAKIIPWKDVPDTPVQ